MNVVSMHPLMISYAALAIAIVSEVTGSTFLQKSEQFTRLWPTVIMTACYVTSFFFLSQALRTIPLGVAYAIWGGLGIVLTAMVGVLVLRQTLDAAAMVGIGLIVSGVMVMNVFSNAATH